MQFSSLTRPAGHVQLLMYGQTEDQNLRASLPQVAIDARCELAGSPSSPCLSPEWVDFDRC